MPELAEVQTIVDDLNKKVVGRKIVGIWSDWPKMLKDPSHQQRNKISYKYVSAFKKNIKDKKILIIKRRAKNILIYLDDNFLLLIHLKMTGHLLVGKWRVKSEKNKSRVIPLEPKEIVMDPYNQYIHLIFYLDNGSMIGFSDVRKFGKVLLGKKVQVENLDELRNLGPEPLDKNFTFKKMNITLQRARERKIKQALIDQKIIAGIGNIYSDEILWKSKIHPFKLSKNLSKKNMKELWRAIHSVLNKALKLRGTSTSDYRDTAGKKGKYTNSRLVYQREGEPCLRCKTMIRRVKIGGRSAHYCPKCQSL